LPAPRRRAEIKKMREQAGKGYLRPVVLKFEIGATRQDLLLVFSLETGNERPILAGFFFSSENFVRQIHQPKILEFASQNFLLTMKQTKSNHVIFATQDLTHETFEQEEAL
jgi:hypothetical protein